MTNRQPTPTLWILLHRFLLAMRDIENNQAIHPCHHDLAPVLPPLSPLETCKLKSNIQSMELSLLCTRGRFMRKTVSVMEALVEAKVWVPALAFKTTQCSLPTRATLEAVEILPAIAILDHTLHLLIITTEVCILPLSLETNRLKVVTTTALKDTSEVTVWMEDMAAELDLMEDIRSRVTMGLFLRMLLPGALLDPVALTHTKGIHLVTMVSTEGAWAMTTTRVV